jgi:hypothetical protein
MPDLYKVATQGVGPDNQPIYDVFSGTEHIQSPTDARLAGVNMAQLPTGVAPITFQSQFNPIKVPDTYKAPTMEEKLGITKADTELALKTKQAEIDKALEARLAAMAPTEEELGRMNRLSMLQEAQTRSIEDVQNRGATGAILTGGAESEISNIQQGKTFASMPNLREQRLLSIQLGNDLARRQIEVDKAKLVMDSGQASLENIQNFQKMVFDMEQQVAESNAKLDERRQAQLSQITTNFAGLAWNDLDQSSKTQLTQLAGQLGIPLKSIQQNLQVAKNALAVDNARKVAELNQIKANTAKAWTDANKSGSDNEQLYSGLSSSTATAVRSKVAKFSTEPLVQNFATIQDGYNFAKSLADTTQNPADDQALIYSLAKALDPGSVVREGEYATAQKYAQSWVQSYGKAVTQALAGTGFLSETARKNIKATIEAKYKASQTSYNNLQAQYTSGINSLTGRNDGDKFLVDYTTGVNPIDNYIDQAVGNQPTEQTNTTSQPQEPSWIGGVMNWLFTGK